MSKKQKKDIITIRQETSTILSKIIEDTDVFFSLSDAFDFIRELENGYLKNSNQNNIID